jgi:hypothetical protein
MFHEAATATTTLLRSTTANKRRANTPTPHTKQHGAHIKNLNHTRGYQHTYDRAVRLPNVDGMLPESWLLDNLKSLQDKRTAIASQHGN